MEGAVWENIFFSWRFLVDEEVLDSFVAASSED